MSDLISRKAAIGTLDDEITITGKSNAYAVKDYVQRVKRKVENLPSAEPRWIPVSERLPEINEHHISDVCLVYCDDGAMAFSEMQENIFGLRFWACERDDDYHEPVGEVVAWMPLPKPYQEEDHETD